MIGFTNVSQNFKVSCCESPASSAASVVDGMSSLAAFSSSLVSGLSATDFAGVLVMTDRIIQRGGIVPPL